MDRICDLPDSILQHILSLLPMKQAVQTSVLSKRWEFLWASISKLEIKEGNELSDQKSAEFMRFGEIASICSCKLEFKEGNEPRDQKSAQFMNFVERALLLRDSSSLHTFSLTCDVPADGPPPRIISWIYAAIRLKVRKMILNLCFDHCHGSFKLPRHLFGCESLEELELDFFFDLSLPSFLYLPNLKSLSLRSVVFIDGSSVQKLFSSCPKLERLHLIGCNWDNVKAVHVYGPMLEHLEIDESRDYEDLEPEPQPDCQFVISGPRLKSFCYTGELLLEFCISDAPSLVHAHVEMYNLYDECMRRMLHRAYKLLRGLANVKSLQVSSLTLQHLKGHEDVAACFPFFHRLNHLEVYDSPLNLTYCALPEMLQNSPLLESICFATEMYTDPFSFWSLDPVPSCFLTHLKIIKLELFDGDEGEVDWLKTILKSAKVLERIDLGPRIKNKIHHHLILDLIEECANSNVVLRWKSERIN